MKQHTSLIIASLLSILLFQLHLVDDIIHGIEQGGLQDLIGGTLINLVWLCGTLILAERRSGHVIMLVGGLLAAVVAYLHMSGKGVGGEFAKTDGAFFFVWTLFALGLTGTFSLVLATLGLWRLRPGQQHQRS